VLKFANFRYHGNKGPSVVNFNDVIKLCNLENSCSAQNVLLYLIDKRSYRLWLKTVNDDLQSLNFGVHCPHGLEEGKR